MVRCKLFTGLIIYLLSTVACTIQDSERCPDGYFYLESAYACCQKETHMPNEDKTKCIPIPEPPSTETEADGGCSDPFGTEGPTGFEEPCTSHIDCEGYEASFCLLGQACSVEGCDITCCPANYTCCGPCEASEDKMVCVPDEYVNLAADMGCDCES